ncbi:MAG TPA: CocE/NonD family hydrolase [Candidatus Dormibacteraeota bacterium]|nr:CocE/NonD family hydrolase [Candidatus Dormibacteraeota bacterium]
MLASGRYLRRFTAIAALAALPLLAACGDGNNNKPRPTPTATLAVQATPTSTSVPATATAVAATATAVPPTATAVPPTATATSVPATATSTPAATDTPTVNPNFRDLRGAAEAAFAAHGSVNQVYVTGATEGDVLELVGDDSVVQQSGTVDAQGALIFRNLTAGAGFRVVAGYPNALSASPALMVTNVDEPPAQSFYESQQVAKGYGYLQTRDGTLLSINVLLPGPIDGGPYPTVIEYSGYDPSNPDSPQPSTLLTSLLGYAAVGVNIRGTGCSGGAFQFFEPLQWTDGYDAIEVIAAQPWVKDHKVAMVGLSYPGISQLFVSQLEPPSLEAVAPLSTIADVGRGTLYPGGILNNGFATDWAAERKHDAQPFGQSWTHKRRDGGDQVCIDNQTLRLQSPDILQMIAENQYYVPEVADPVTPALFVHKISVPVFLAHAWQDEQVGGYAPNMIDHFTGTDKKHFTLVNGGHSEPLIPAIFHRWIEFLSFYVRKETPVSPLITSAILGFLGSNIFGATDLTLPADRFAGMPYEQALAAFEAEKPVRVLFESGTGFPGQPGAPVPGFEASFDSWPIPVTQATAWYLADGGVLSEEPVSTDAIDTFAYDATDSQRGDLASGNGNDSWLAQAPWDWRPLVDGRAVAYATAPLAADTVMIGTGSVDLMVRADAADVDLQVTLSEIRPDGQENYIQNGWLRASRRKLDEAESTELRPVATHRLADAAPLPAGEFALVRIELFPFAHAFRAGSRIRLSVEAPGGDRAIWKFDALPTSATVEIALDGSRVVLPVVPGIEVPTALPPCNALRAQPCRAYEEIDNSVN